jgi:excisionase family DNA binding protein
MGGMFYSLREAAEKLNKTEGEVRQLAKDGKLREFRDGSNLLFKIDEVESLMSDATVSEALEVQPVSEPPAEQSESIELEEAEQPEPTMEPEPSVEPEEAQAYEPEPEPIFEPETAQAPGEVPEPEPVVEPEAAQESEAASELEPVLESETAQVSEPALEPESATEQEEEEEISLAPEAAASGSEKDISNLDTAMTGEGISVLGETDRDYKLTDDTMAETISPTGTESEASLEEIEEDVNLDSFGSGSGLLDLSLQADDTSLGGILDEIYTSEGGEESPEPAESDSAVGVAAEAEQMLPQEEQIAGPQPMPEVPLMAQTYVEPQPDVQSNALGMLLLLPLFVLLYTAIVTIAAQRGVIPSILALIQSIIWYIVIGAIVATGLVIGAAFMLGRDVTKAPKKEKKSRRTKKKDQALEEQVS